MPEEWIISDEHELENKKRELIKMVRDSPRGNDQRVTEILDELENDEAKKKYEDVYKLKAALEEKDKEIETLKALLEWSKEDEQEWKEHKEIFSFMSKKNKVMRDNMRRGII